MNDNIKRKVIEICDDEEKPNKRQNNGITLNQLQKAIEEFNNVRCNVGTLLQYLASLNENSLSEYNNWKSEKIKSHILRELDAIYKKNTNLPDIEGYYNALKKDFESLRQKQKLHVENLKKVREAKKKEDRRLFEECVERSIKVKYNPTIIIKTSHPFTESISWDAYRDNVLRIIDTKITNGVLSFHFPGFQRNVTFDLNQGYLDYENDGVFNVHWKSNLLMFRIRFNLKVITDRENLIKSRTYAFLCLSKYATFKEQTLIEGEIIEKENKLPLDIVKNIVRMMSLNNPYNDKNMKKNL